jgi:MFS transporter, putative metabolite:H+ symporter
MSSVNAGPRLDRLPISRFHRRVFALVGIGMFLDGFDIYLASTVIGTTLKTGFATMEQSALFVASTFVGMMIGSLIAGFIGDRYGRSFTYQLNLLIFGLASVAAGFSWNMNVLILMRFLMGLGLGAENVVGYSAVTEFIPARLRGRWLGILAMIFSCGLPAAILLSTYLIPSHPTQGWRTMFFIGGGAGLLIWWMRKALTESPRWLESVGRNDEAEDILRDVEAECRKGLNGELPPIQEVAGGPAPPKVMSALFRRPYLGRIVVGSLVLIIINSVVHGFVIWLPTFFILQGMTMSDAFRFAMVMSLGAPLGAGIAAVAADLIGRKPTAALACIAAIGISYVYPTIRDPLLLPVVGLALTAPIFVLMALLFGIYIPELFPTELRLRAAGICNMFGRGATIGTPFIVIYLFDTQGVGGVTTVMEGLLAVLALVLVIFGVEPAKRSLEEITSVNAISTPMPRRSRPVKDASA